MKSIIVIVLAVVASMAAGLVSSDDAAGVAGPVFGRIAQIEDTNGVFVWSEPNAAIVGVDGATPDGMEIDVTDGSAVIACSGRTPGTHTVLLTVYLAQKPFPDWDGPMVSVPAEGVIVWKVLSRENPFPDGFGDILIRPGP